jgi:hypothetical protein
LIEAFKVDRRNSRHQNFKFWQSDYQKRIILAYYSEFLGAATLYLVYEMMVQLNEELEDWREIVQVMLTPEELEALIERSELFRYMISDSLDFVPMLESKQNKKRRITTDDSTGDKKFGDVNLTQDYNMNKINELIAHTGKMLDYNNDEEFFEYLTLYCEENNVSPSHAVVKWRPIIPDPSFVTLSAEKKRTGLNN